MVRPQAMWSFGARRGPGLGDFWGPQGVKKSQKNDKFPTDPKSIPVTKSSGFGQYWAVFGSCVTSLPPLELPHWPSEQGVFGLPRLGTW